jgi:hypothetical protein
MLLIQQLIVGFWWPQLFLQGDNHHRGSSEFSRRLAQSDMLLSHARHEHSRRHAAGSSRTHHGRHRWSSRMLASRMLVRQPPDTACVCSGLAARLLWPGLYRSCTEWQWPEETSHVCKICAPVNLIVQCTRCCHLGHCMFFREAFQRDLPERRQTTEKWHNPTDLFLLYRGLARVMCRVISKWINHRAES